ncbi:hypothetical protein ACJX0J_020023, partial [Zea mays]
LDAKQDKVMDLLKRNGEPHLYIITIMPSSRSVPKIHLFEPNISLLQDEHLLEACYEEDRFSLMKASSLEVYMHHIFIWLKRDAKGAHKGSKKTAEKEDDADKGVLSKEEAYWWWRADIKLFCFHGVGSNA